MSEAPFVEDLATSNVAMKTQAMVAAGGSMKNMKATGTIEAKTTAKVGVLRRSMNTMKTTKVKARAKRTGNIVAIRATTNAMNAMEAMKAKTMKGKQPIVACMGDLKDVRSWLDQLSEAEQSSAPVSRVPNALRLLELESSRHTRKQIQSLLRAWDIKQNQ